jgi:hypothetical protein
LVIRSSERARENPCDLPSYRTTSFTFHHHRPSNLSAFDVYPRLRATPKKGIPYVSLVCRGDINLFISHDLVGNSLSLSFDDGFSQISRLSLHSALYCSRWQLALVMCCNAPSHRLCDILKIYSRPHFSPAIYNLVPVPH